MRRLVSTARVGVASCAEAVIKAVNRTADILDLHLVFIGFCGVVLFGCFVFTGWYLSKQNVFKILERLFETICLKTIQKTIRQTSYSAASAKHVHNELSAANTMNVVWLEACPKSILFQLHMAISPACKYRANNIFFRNSLALKAAVERVTGLSPALSRAKTNLGKTSSSSAPSAKVR